MRKILLAFLFLGFLLPNIANAADEEPGAEIVQLGGIVEVTFAQEKEYVPAEEDMFLAVFDSIRTGNDSFAELAFDENGENLIRLNSNTQVIFILKDEKLQLIEGEIFATIGDLEEGSTFEIKTPTAVAGVRGTDWVTRVDEEGSDIESIEGYLYVHGFNDDGSRMAEPITVTPGFKTRVKRHHRPGALSKLPKAKRERWRRFKGDVRGRARKVLEHRKALPGMTRRHDRMLHNQKDLLRRGKINRPRHYPAARDTRKAQRPRGAGPGPGEVEGQKDVRGRKAPRRPGTGSVGAQRKLSDAPKKPARAIRRGQLKVPRPDKKEGAGKKKISDNKKKFKKKGKVKQDKGNPFKKGKARKGKSKSRKKGGKPASKTRSRARRR